MLVPASASGRDLGFIGLGLDRGIAMNEDFADAESDVPAPSRSDEAAAASLGRFFEDHREAVFFSRQLEVAHEAQWFHWVTSRALRRLIEERVISHERRDLGTGGTIHLMWHRSYRYYRREASRVVALVEEYADPNIGAALGLHGEALTLEGFASHQFVMHGRDASEFQDRRWTQTGHNLDFIFERDGLAYGVEVKNTLGYMDQSELRIKVAMCHHLSVAPVIVARMLPKTWINEIIGQGGFALILKYQLYPWAHRELAKTVRETFGLPVDAPRRLQDGTMQRFARWHTRRT